MTGLSSASHILRMLLGAMAGSTSAKSGGVLRSRRLPLAKEAESTKNSRWMVSTPSSDAALSKLGRVEITPSTPSFSTHQRTAASSRPSPSARSMWRNTALPASRPALTMASSSKMEVEIRKMAATGLSMARRFSSGSRTEAMTGRFSSRLSSPHTVSPLI